VELVERIEEELHPRAGSVRLAVENAEGRNWTSIRRHPNFKRRVAVMQPTNLGTILLQRTVAQRVPCKFRRDAAGPNDVRRGSFDFAPVEREHAFDVLDAISPIAERNNVSVARVALAWLLHQKCVMSVIVGARTSEQLSDNMAAALLILSTDDLAALDAASTLRQEYPRWMLERQSAGRVPQTC
jgi:aryl-alcohol dehydrogenase-like predicted oxidoreductase